MEVENSTKSENSEIQIDEDENIMKLLKHLITNENAVFKSQQRGEDELTDEMKQEIALDILKRNKCNFLVRFGKYCKAEDLNYFKKFCTDEKDGYEITFYLKELSRYHNESLRKKDVKNRRYQALEKLKTDSTYFSEVEMMRRNPLLYEQLVGQYMTEEERKIRDKLTPEECSFTNILLEGYQREETQKFKHSQEDREDEMMEESEDENNSDNSEFDDKYSVSKMETKQAPYKSTKTKINEKWGEWDNLADRRLDEIQNTIETVKREKNWYLISDEEKGLLKEEFKSHMYQSFLNGQDKDFDYSEVDFDTSYDNIEVKTQDAEEKYFDSESPEEITEADNVSVQEHMNESSEDELDKFMDRLNQHPTICQLTNDLKKINA